ncbi:serine-enriched protein isoform X3 [Tenebrio molitor]|uniref:serine-enriched protein isoform X3 n=1 Tax=Tenebrio molitor TaxID=7067 RepID=UPI0036247C20
MPESLLLPASYIVMAEAEPDLSTFENKTGLAEDMKFLASMPELCDVTFLVGDTREPVCAVKAVLAARSRVFHKMLYQAPSPQRKKEPPPRENKLRLFLKRSSEPLLNLQNASQQPPSQQHQTLIIEEFEPDVFRQLIEYIHTGCVTLQPRTLLGVMNAADYYGLDELRRACAGFVQCCINVDTVCALLASAERYIQYKCTKTLVQKVLEFVDEHGNEVLNLGSFTLLPQHVVRLILARDELHADEFTKFQAALMWGKKYCDNNPSTSLKDVIGRPGKCRPRKTVTQQSKAASAGPVHVRSKLPGPVWLQHDVEQQRIQRARFFRWQAFFQLTYGHCRAATPTASSQVAITLPPSLPSSPDGDGVVVVAVFHTAIVSSAHLHLHDRAQEGHSQRVNQPIGGFVVAKETPVYLGRSNILMQ